SVFLLMEWAYTGSNMKSKHEVQRLVDNVICAPNFKSEDLRNFNITRETARLDATDVANAERQSVDGWYHASIHIPSPKERTKYGSERDAPHFR
ncbi:hypothetical protein DAEQUDRAFT_655538, partial [Daedalea quercina L-15889]